MNTRISRLLLVAAGTIVLGCLLLAACLVKRIACGADVRAEIERIRRAGAPASVLELAAPGIPRSTNAARSTRPP